MNKKQYREMMYSREQDILASIEEIEFVLFTTLQLETRNTIIIDSATNQPLLLNNKYMTYPKNDMNDKEIVCFDPINNNRLSQFLLSVYMRNYQMEVEHIQSYFMSQLDQSGKGIVTCRTMRGDISSDPYYNESLRYISLILKMESSHLQVNIPLIDDYINFIKDERILERIELNKQDRPERVVKEAVKRSPFIKIV